jgi:hypothetical protein
MLVATVVLTGPAVVRIPAMVHDRRTRGRVHPAYLAGRIGVLVVGQRMAVSESEASLVVGRAILTLFSS